MTTTTVYIALGSNKGDRFINLQEANQHIFNTIGTISAIAKVYKTDAVGFEADYFYNTCIAVSTHLSAKVVLDELLRIEKRLGRERTQTEGYESRTIDLDVILYGDVVLWDDYLQLPHPRMHQRRFVLQPLNDIAAEVVHPQLQKTITELLETCEDVSAVDPVNIWLKNPIQPYNFKDYNFIAIEGNIGAGKTSLATKISDDFNGKLLLEQFTDNPFLPKFYENPNQHAFPLEMSFMAERYQQITDNISQLDLFKDFVVSDYHVYKSLVFSKITLQEDEFKLYRKLFYMMYKNIKKPDVYVYLHRGVEELQQNIQKRGREFERQISNVYLEQISDGYKELLKIQNDELNIKVIDVSGKDFIANRSDYLAILSEIACKNE